MFKPGRVGFVSCLLFSACVAGGCSSTMVGKPTADPSESSNHSTVSTKSLDSCKVLANDLGKLQLQPGVEGALQETSRGVGARECAYKSSADHGTGVTIALWDSKGLNKLNYEGEKPEQVTVGSHHAYKVQNSANPGICELDISVSESSTATVIGGSHTNTPAACDLMNRAAQTLEPKLPKPGN